MASNFKVDIEGLDVFKKQLTADATMERIIPDFTLAVLQLHNTLERRVKEVYNAPGQLSSVMIGKDVKPSRLGATLLRYSLQYRHKAIPLDEYPYEISESDATSSAPLRRSQPLGRVDWKEGQWSKDIKVRIRKDKAVFAKQGKNYRLKGFIQGGKIKARKQKATWTTYPSKGEAGVRAPYSVLFGPSLAILASSIFDKDKQVQLSVDKMQEQIISAFVRFYK